MAGIATGTLFRGGIERNNALSQTVGTAEFTVDTPATTALYTEGREWKGPNGEIYFEAFINELVPAITSATLTTTSKIPAGTTSVQVGTYVKATLAGNSVSNYECGISGALTRFFTTTTNITAGDTNAGSAYGAGITPYTSDTAIVITTDQICTSGSIRVVARCCGVRPPTS